MLKKEIISSSIVLNSPYNNIFKGAEGFIVQGKKQTIYKIFKSKDKEKLKNKYKKILKISDLNIDFFTNPISLLTCENRFVGYEMPYEREYKRIDVQTIKKQDMINYFKKLKEMLLELERKNIIYTDLKASNILVDPNSKNLKLCDIDNIQIENLKSDKLLLVLKNINLENNPDFDIHAYLHNLLIIKEFIGLGRFNIAMSNLVLNDQDRDYIRHDFGPEGIEIVEEIIKTEKNPKIFSKRYLIDKLN